MPGMSHSRPVAVGQRGAGAPDSEPTGRIVDERSRVCTINNRREIMRTLTVNEIGFVSGGEAPCITLQTQCVGPAPTARQVAGAFNTAAIALQAAAMKNGNARTKALLEGLALGAAAAAEFVSWFED